MSTGSKVVLSAKNETESGLYPNRKQFIAEKKLIGTHAQLRGTPRARQQQQLHVDTAAALRLLTAAPHCDSSLWLLTVTPHCGSSLWLLTVTPHFGSSLWLLTAAHHCDSSLEIKVQPSHLVLVLVPMSHCVWSRRLRLRLTFSDQLKLKLAPCRNQKCPECGTTTFSRNQMSSRSVQFPTFGAETETESKTWSTSTVDTLLHSSTTAAALCHFSQH